MEDWQMIWHVWFGYFFTVYLMTSSLTHNVHAYREWLNLEGRSKKRPWPNLKYLTGICLQGAKSIKTKRKRLNLKAKQMHWLLGRRATLSIESKLLLYKAVLKPIWAFGIQI
jgi:hypothetical protein